MERSTAYNGNLGDVESWFGGRTGRCCRLLVLKDILIQTEERPIDVFVRNVQVDGP